MNIFYDFLLSFFCTYCLPSRLSMILLAAIRVVAISTSISAWHIFFSNCLYGENGGGYMYQWEGNSTFNAGGGRLSFLNGTAYFHFHFHCESHLFSVPWFPFQFWFYSNSTLTHSLYWACFQGVRWNSTG